MPFVEKLKTTFLPTKTSKKVAVPEHPGRATRETIESVIIAIILAFLFRTFEAEAFVIPTGSMAPTLQGAHRDVACPQCGYRYRTGASLEHTSPNKVVGVICPICRFSQVLNPTVDPNSDTFSGDRILVSKFAYQLGEPERWDPIVFKFPGNPKQNYIKRLVGLPGEVGRIYHGDVYVVPPGEQKEVILRKPAHKVVAMLQVVDDASFQSPALLNVKWPSRWQSWSPPSSSQPAKWSMSPDQRSFTTDGQGGASYVRYKHLVPFESDWLSINEGKLPDDMQNREGQLISDFYTYNFHYAMDLGEYERIKFAPPDDYEGLVLNGAYGSEHNRMANPTSIVLGKHWVGDLALEAEVNVASSSGELLFDLVEGGSHYTCSIDVQSGVAKLQIDGGQTPFVDDTGKETPAPEAQTVLRGPGQYHVRLSNCDDEVLLWINGRVVAFSAPTTYATRLDCAPEATAQDPGDLAPAGIGTNKASFTVSGMRILRDVYYIASNSSDGDYQATREDTPDQITHIFTTPSTWSTTSLFASRGELRFANGADQYFPLGDNSPESMDARSWIHGDRSEIPGEPHYAKPYVERKLLIGKALLIYWPHAWNRPIPFTPNVQRMGVIR